MSYLSEEKKWLLHFVLSVTGTINFFNFFFSSKCRQNKFKTIHFLHISYTLAYYYRKNIILYLIYPFNTCIGHYIICFTGF